MNIVKFLRKDFFIEHLRWLLLAFTTTYWNYYWENFSVILFTLIHASNRLREATVLRFFSKNVFSKIFTDFTRNTCVQLSLLKRHPNAGVLFSIMRNFREHLFLKTTSSGCFLDLIQDRKKYIKVWNLFKIDNKAIGKGIVKTKASK